MLLGSWAVYNTIRYFIAFMKYGLNDGQAMSLALGISTAISFALLLCAVILSIFQPYLLLHQVPLRTLLFARKGFDTFGSFFLLAPAIYNLVMTFIWRNSTNPELNFQRRCHVDIDVIWSISKTHCNARVWGTWLALSIVRLALTLLIIVSPLPNIGLRAHIVLQIAYHMISYRMGRPSYAPHQYHYRHRSQLSESQSSLPPSLATNLPSYEFPGKSSHIPHHHSSDSTLSSLTHSKQSSSHRSRRALRTRASASTLYSDEDTALEAESNDHTTQPLQDQEPNSFAERFRTLISQISRETEVALEIATPDTVLDVENRGFYMPPVPPAIGYDEFGRPYRPEEQVSFLNRYIRRMPTIESMGSREQGTAASKENDTSRRNTFSPPPSRSNTLAVSEYSIESHGPSRGSSLSACENLSTGQGRTTEMGELVDKGSEEGYDASKGSSAATSGRTTSASTVSYYTATSFGSAVPPLSEDVPPFPLGLDGMPEHVK